MAESTISGFSNVLSEDEAPEAELNEAMALAETVRKKDGFKELVDFASKASVVGVVGTLIWRDGMHESACGLADALFPDGLVELVASFF